MQKGTIMLSLLLLFQRLMVKALKNAFIYIVIWLEHHGNRLYGCNPHSRRISTIEKSVKHYLLIVSETGVCLYPRYHLSSIGILSMTFFQKKRMGDMQTYIELTNINNLFTLTIEIIRDFSSFGDTDFYRTQVRS